MKKVLKGMVIALVIIVLLYVVLNILVFSR